MKIGDIVSRKKYHQDIIFEVIDKTRVMPVDIPTVPNAENISKKVSCIGK